MFKFKLSNHPSSWTSVQEASLALLGQLRFSATASCFLIWLHSVMIITTNNGGGYDGSKGYYLWASGEKGLISGCTGEKSNGYQAGGVPLGEWWDSS